MNGWRIVLGLTIATVVAIAIWFQTEHEVEKRNKAVKEAADKILDIADDMRIELDKGFTRERILRGLAEESFKRERLWYKESQRLQQRLNRISNLTIGNERIWRLDEIANEFEVTADMAAEEPDETDPDRETRNRALALYVRRLEWDLGEIHEAVRGATNRRGGRYDGANWKGVRP